MNKRICALFFGVIFSAPVWALMPEKPAAPMPDHYGLADRHGPLTMDKGVVGHSYFLRITTKTDVQEKCATLVGKTKNDFIDNAIGPEEFVFDYQILCREVDKDMREMLISLIIEPRSEGEISALEAYLAKMKAQDFYGVPVEFKTLKRFEAEKTFTALHFPAPRKKPDHRYTIVSTQIQVFPNFEQYRLHLMTEAAGMVSAQQLAPVASYISQFMHPHEFELFQYHGFRKSNVIVITNKLRSVLENGDKIDALMPDESYANCAGFGQKLCLE